MAGRRSCRCCQMPEKERKVNPVLRKFIFCALRPTFTSATCVAFEQYTAQDESCPYFSYRKEVIQPQVPLRLPCYDFVPITTPALGPCPLAVGSDTSGGSGFHDVTGGVYKARERIHGSVADLPLLAIPASWSRVADSNLNWAWLWGFPPPRGLGSFCTRHCSTCAALDVRAILT